MKHHCISILSIYWAILIIISLGCGEEHLEKESTRDLANHFIKEKLPKEFEPSYLIEYEISDSLYIKSLNTLLYKVNQGVADGNEYVLLFDLSSMEIYPLIYQHWGMYNRPLKKDLAAKVLESEETKKDIEAVNYSLLYLEIFLNQNEIIYKDGINYDAIDSVFQFYLNKEHKRITSIQELDSIAQKRKGIDGNLLSENLYWNESETLKDKIGERGVFIYQDNYEHPFEYFEINPSANIRNYSGEAIFERMYNLKYLLW